MVYYKKKYVGKRKRGASTSSRKRKNPFNAFTGKRRKFVRKPRVGGTSIKRTYLPLTQIVKFRRTEEVTVDVAAGVVVESVIKIKPQQVNDPFNHDDNLHQCAQWDKAMEGYGKGTVIRSECMIRKLETVSGANGATYWGAFVDNSLDRKFDIAGLTMAELLSTTGIAKPALAVSPNAQSNVGYNKGNFKKVVFDPKKFFKINTAMLHANGVGELTGATSPNQNAYTCGPTYDRNGQSVPYPEVILYGCAPGVLDPSPVTFMVTMEYTVKLYDRDPVSELLDETA